MVTRITGHCSRCGKIWTLETQQGVCQWCNKPSSCQTTTTQPRSIKSNRRRKQRQAPSNGNGYESLEGEWLTRYKVASRFAHKAKAEDREDLLHDIIITLADVERNNGHKPFTEAAMYRIASRAVADYWRAYYKVNNGLDCHSCSKAQRQKCRSEWLYTECPKAIKLEYLSKPITDGDGNLTELGELIADDKAIDLDAWLDAKRILRGLSRRLVQIAHKRLDGIPLTGTEQRHLNRYQKKHQLTLF